MSNEDSRMFLQNQVLKSRSFLDIN